MRIIPLLALLALTAPLATAQTGKVIAPPPDVAAAPADAAKTRSGLASKVIKPGTGKDTHIEISFCQIDLVHIDNFEFPAA